MDEQHNRPAEPSEEELRAAYEQQLSQITVEDVVVQTVVSLLNLGARRAGLTGAPEGEKDLEQVRMAVEGARALLPLVEAALGPDAPQLRTALSQLQLVYAREAPGTAAAAPGDQPAPGAPRPADDAAPSGQPDKPGPAQASGRLWVPGR